MDIPLSRYGSASTQPSPVNRMMAEFARGFRDGIDINLGVGFVNEQTIPVAYFHEALQAIAADGITYRQAFNYGGPEGSANLIAAIRRFLTRLHIGQLDTDTVDRKRTIIGPCGATSLLDAMAEVLAPGIVIMSDPMYYIYSDSLERKGFEVLAVPEDRDGIDLEALDRKLRELGDRAREVSFFYLVTVNNPSCTILSNARRKALYEAAARLSRQQNRRIPIFFDLAYELLLHDPEAEPMISALPYDELDIVYEIGTLSKVLAPSLRIGYLMGPDGPFMRAMVQKTSDTGFSAPPFVQEMAGYMLDRHIETQLRAVNAGYRRKALTVQAALEKQLGGFLSEYRGGSAGFYFYLTFDEIETHPKSEFFRLLGQPEDPQEPRVIYIPGEFCVHPRGELAALGRRQLRLSYAFESSEVIVRALGYMHRAAESLLGRQTVLPLPEGE